MKQTDKILLISAAVLVVISLALSINISGGEELNEISVEYKTVSSGSTGNGDVSIELTPIEVNNNHLKVRIDVNTHTVDLNQFDLKELTTLEYKGISSNPISAPALGGHHDSGELIFETNDYADVFTIKINGVPDVEERVFRWP